jgi:hypothetical protein
LNRLSRGEVSDVDLEVNFITWFIDRVVSRYLDIEEERGFLEEQYFSFVSEPWLDDARGQEGR